MTVISRYGDLDATLDVQNATLAAVLHHERYDATAADAHIASYDVRLADYNTRHGLPGRWTDRVLARLASQHSLSGRHVLRAQLERLGLPSR